MSAQDFLRSQFGSSYVNKLAQGQENQRRIDAEKRRQQGQAFQVPGFDRQFGRYTQEANAAGGRMAGEQFRDTQGALLRQLQADANGNGPGQQLVRMQAQGMADRGAQQQLAMAAGVRPGQAASAGRNAAFNAAGLQSQVGGQAAQAGLQARLGAMSQMGQVAGQARQGDYAQMGLNDNTQLEALRQRMQLSGMQQGGQISLAQLQQQQNQFNRSQPAWWERGLGAATQIAGTGALFMGGGGGNARQNPGSGGYMNTPDSDYFNAASQDALNRM
jgi:hypothetical protein